MTGLAATLYVVLLLAGWALTLLGWAGTWLMLAAAVAMAWWMPEESRLAVRWGTVAGLGFLALLGEVLESAAGALGARKAGGSKRSVALSMVASLVGALVGAGAGSAVVPLLGTVIGALLGAGGGAMGGALLGEKWKGRTLKEGLKTGRAAFWGRILGTLGKTLIAGCMLIIGLAALAIY